MRELEEDPRVLYYTGVGPAVPEAGPGPAYPWNAVQPLTDSTAMVETPGNLREGDRAYQAYAVERMRNVRSDPDVPCDSLVAREAVAAGAFSDGWLVSRVLFGAPPYPPLDELPLAHADGHLPALLAAFGDRQLGGCGAAWREANARAVEAYLAWREEAFPEAPAPPEGETADARPEDDPL